MSWKNSDKECMHFASWWSSVELTTEIKPFSNGTWLTRQLTTVIPLILIQLHFGRYHLQLFLWSQFNSNLISHQKWKHYTEGFLLCWKSEVSNYSFWLGADVDAETPILWPPVVKNWLIWKDPDAGKDWGLEEKGTTENEMVGWHHWLNGHGFGRTPRVGNGQGGPACCGEGQEGLGCKQSDTTEQLNWTESLPTIPWLSWFWKSASALTKTTCCKTKPLAGCTSN